MSNGSNCLYENFFSGHTKNSVQLKKEVLALAKLMSDALKWELAKELGVDQIVATEGWGGVPSRECGNLVRKAIELAERSMVNSPAGKF
jgi:small acid-soluble spore protein F (minor alpha/beta-type SASP)